MVILDDNDGDYILAYDRICTITARAVHEDDATIGPVAALKLRPYDTIRGVVTSFRDGPLPSTVAPTNFRVHRVHRPSRHCFSLVDFGPRPELDFVQSRTQAATGMLCRVVAVGRDGTGNRSGYGG